MRRHTLTTTKILAVAFTAVSTVSITAGAAPAQRPTLIELRDQLAGTERSQALAESRRFRPLCDRRGYPLVGNLVRKSAQTDSLLPSEFCAAVRKQQG